MKKYITSNWEDCFTQLENGEIDILRLREIVEYASPLKVVFHRAFDDAKKPEKDISELIDMGIIRILTSGQENSAIEGQEFIKKIQEKYGSQITIMPGAGINSVNIEKLIENTGCSNYHLSGKVDRGSKMKYLSRENSILNIREFSVEMADFKKIKSVKNIMNKYIDDRD